MTYQKNKINTQEEEADEIIKRLSYPKPRVLQARWTYDAVQDLTQIGIDFEAELAQAITEEIDKEILKQLKGMK